MTRVRQVTHGTDSLLNFLTARHVCIVVPVQVLHLRARADEAEALLKALGESLNVCSLLPYLILF